MSEHPHQQPLDTETFQRTRRWYLLALAGVLLTIIVAQLLIQYHLNTQLDDSRVINVAGRQRAYSQKLTKEALLLTKTTDASQKKIIIANIRETLRVWMASHYGLQQGSDSLTLPKEVNVEILVLFKQLQQHYEPMVEAAEKMIALHTKVPIDTEKEAEALGILLHNEPDFLRIMDTIVNQYDVRSKEQLLQLKRKEYLLLGVSFLILLLEMLFIFRPLSLQIRKTISRLLESQKKTENHAFEMQQVLAEKEKSLQELQEINFVIDNAALFASARKDGSIVFISKKFLQLLALSEKDINIPLSKILTTNEGQQEYLKEMFKGNRKNVIRTEEIEITTRSGTKYWLEMSIVPMHQSSKEQTILILCSNSTERKKNEAKVAQLTQQHFDERMLQKKTQASLIVEGQEEERKRIAKDIHDGIGQMLTALKFNIESINVDDIEKTKEKIAYIKLLTTDLIKGVRTATFNLTPPELGDHGIFPALQKMTSELSRLTGKNILYENKSDAQIRFDSLAETNIYRVTQEAVNNAIKYAQANYILVSVNFNDTLLSVVIDDDGKGFDVSHQKDLPKKSTEGGMGLFFMKERISYINGRLFLHSKIGEGTRITINYTIGALHLEQKTN